MTTVREAACILIRARDTDRHLLAQRGPAVSYCPGAWELSAGGSIEPGETPLRAACRELLEELGPVPLLTVSLPVHVFHSDAAKPHVYHVFEGWCDEEFTPVPPDSGIVSAWAWTSTPLDYDLEPGVTEELLALGIIGKGHR